MSRYEVDKAIMALAHNEDSEPFETFLKDPGRFLEGRTLTEPERQAFLDHAVDKLYALGAQPYILSALVRKLAQADRATGRDTAALRYTELIQPYGRPDYST
ncbi:MAG: hypothetical protein AAB289_06180 [Chloroflexota bacterium]